MAEKLTAMHGWADMARLARTGGEADAIAVRIARAATGRDGVALCGYHGWHDWYLAANLTQGDSLAGHLLPGLEPRGVPASMRDSVFPFQYNDFEELVALAEKQQLAAIIISPPSENRSQKVGISLRTNMALPFRSAALPP